MNEYIEKLSSNQIGILPHDTIPGIVAIMNTENAKRILKIKERSEKKGFIILIPNKNYLSELTINTGEKTKHLINDYWPGALTIIFHKHPKVPPLISGTETTVAIRYPNHPLLNSILTAINQPLITTSANISSESMISEELLSRVDFIHPEILSNSSVSQSSTIVDGTKENLPIL